VVMPGMSGRDLSQRLIAARPELRVLYMSGYTENVFAHQGASQESIAFLPKPLTPDALLVRVREVLGADGGPSSSDQQERKTQPVLEFAGQPATKLTGRSYGGDPPNFE